LAAPEAGKELGRLTPEDNPRLPLPSPEFHFRQNRMFGAFKDLEAIRQKGQALKRREANPPQDFQKWEALYQQHLSPLSYLLAVFPARLERMDVQIPAVVRERLAENEKRCRLLFLTVCRVLS
jgi:hypothetical protein